MQKQLACWLNDLGIDPTKYRESELQLFALLYQAYYQKHKTYPPKSELNNWLDEIAHNLDKMQFIQTFIYQSHQEPSAYYALAYIDLSHKNSANVLTKQTNPQIKLSYGADNKDHILSLCSQPNAQQLLVLVFTEQPCFIQVGKEYYKLSAGESAEISKLSAVEYRAQTQSLQTPLASTTYKLDKSLKSRIALRKTSA